MPYVNEILSKPKLRRTKTMTTKLVMFKAYADNQQGYDAARMDGAIYTVDIDEASYSSMYNVQQSIQATCKCLGADRPALGVERDGIYISLSVIEDTSLNSQLDYQDLDDAFELGLVHLKINNEHLAHLRDGVDESLTELMNALGECDERGRVDHCIQVLENN